MYGKVEFSDKKTRVNNLGRLSFWLCARLTNTWKQHSKV